MGEVPGSTLSTASSGRSTARARAANARVASSFGSPTTTATEAAKLMALRHLNLDKLGKIAEVACGIEKDESKAADLISERNGKIDYGPKVFKP